MPTLTTYTIGHSNHSAEEFLNLLRAHAIEVLVDVRSQPVSRYCPQFERLALELSLRAARIRYMYLGRELGGRPADQRYYDSDGYVRYDRVAGSPAFAEGVTRVERLAGRSRAALMCSEEDPRDCHRHLLIGRVLKERGVAVVHIRGDGSLTTRDDLEARRGARQLGLFEDAEPNTWKSTQSVSPRSLRVSSSEP
jgi:uncharacterized protein (DUF488 family)